MRIYQLLTILIMTTKSFGDEVDCSPAKMLKNGTWIKNSCNQSPVTVGPDYYLYKDEEVGNATLPDFEDVSNEDDSTDGIDIDKTRQDIGNITRQVNDKTRQDLDKTVQAIAVLKRISANLRILTGAFEKKSREDKEIAAKIGRHIMELRTLIVKVKNGNDSHGDISLNSNASSLSHSTWTPTVLSLVVAVQFIILLCCAYKYCCNTQSGSKNSRKGYWSSTTDLL